MGQERKFHLNNLTEFDLHEIDLAQRFLDSLKIKQLMVQEEQKKKLESDKHEVILYDNFGKPVSQDKTFVDKLFTPRFSFISKRFSKIHRICMATLCTFTTISLIFSSGFNLGYLKYLNVLT